jgi:hypothetical protein
VQEGIGEGEGAAVRAMEFTKDVAQNFMPSYLPSTFTQDRFDQLNLGKLITQDRSDVDHNI